MDGEGGEGGRRATLLLPYYNNRLTSMLRYHCNILSLAIASFRGMLQNTNS